MATISFARGAPSLDIVDVEGLSEASRQAFAEDPAKVQQWTAFIDSVEVKPGSLTKIVDELADFLMFQAAKARALTAIRSFTAGSRLSRDDAHGRGK